MPKRKENMTFMDGIVLFTLLFSMYLGGPIKYGNPPHHHIIPHRPPQSPLGDFGPAKGFPYEIQDSRSSMTPSKIYIEATPKVMRKKEEVDTSLFRVGTFFFGSAS